MTTIACSISNAWLARNVNCSMTRARSRRRDPRACSARTRGPTRAARARSALKQPQPDRQRDRGERRSRSRRPALPGRTVQPRRSTASVAGAIRLRRRLSRIFQRAMSGRRLRCRPVRDGTNGNSHHENLPVAAHPAMLPPRVREHARRIVVDDLDVGDERGPRVEPLEQIVRQQRVLRHAPVERRRRTRRRRRGPCR